MSLAIEEATAAHEAFYAALERGDPQAMEELWADTDDVFCLHPGWAPLHGRSAVLRSCSAIMAGTEQLHFLLTDVRVRLATDTAVITCTENILTGEISDGTRVSGIGAAAAINVLQRQPAGWRVLAHHSAPLSSEVEG